MLFRYRRRRNASLGFLIIAIVMMSVGFSAFSSELTISSSAIVQPDSSGFRVVLSSVNGEEVAGQVSGVGSSEVVTPGYATIDNTGASPSLSGLSAGFTEPGQSVTYKFYIYNSGAYVAYLNSIKFGVVEGSDGLSKVCTAIDSANTTESLLSAACGSINVNVTIGNTDVSGTAMDISNNTIEKNSYKEAIVTIYYSSGNNISDGDFNVEFGDISLEFSSQD